jgi:hypothetical protein
VLHFTTVLEGFGKDSNYCTTEKTLYYDLRMIANLEFYPKDIRGRLLFLRRGLIAN